MARSRTASDSRFSIDIDPSPAAIGKFAGVVGSGLRDWRPVFNRLVPQYRRELKHNYQGRGQLLGPWPSPDEQYAERKARSGFGRTQLVRTGEMLSQLDDPPIKVNATTLVMGVDAPQARAIHWGNKKAGIEPRAIIGWTPRMQTLALDSVDREAKRRLKTAARLLAASAGHDS